MCEYGRTVPVRVKIPADLACSGESYWKEAQIDACIAPLIKALQDGGIDMRGSCCGHGVGVGHIHLQDGRGLLVLEPKANAAWMTASSTAGGLEAVLQVIRRRCEWCAKGEGPVLLDDDGVAVAVSGKPGKWRHAYEDSFWECHEMDWAERLRSN